MEVRPTYERARTSPRPSQPSLLKALAHSSISSRTIVTTIQRSGTPARAAERIVHKAALACGETVDTTAVVAHIGTPSWIRSMWMESSSSSSASDSHSPSPPYRRRSPSFRRAAATSPDGSFRSGKGSVLERTCAPSFCRDSGSHKNALAGLSTAASPSLPASLHFPSPLLARRRASGLDDGDEAFLQPPKLAHRTRSRVMGVKSGA